MSKKESEEKRKTQKDFKKKLVNLSKVTILKSREKIEQRIRTRAPAEER